MEVSTVEAGPVLAVDITPLQTRVLLFDVVEGHYRLVAQGEAPTTAYPPMHDAGEGVRLALERLSEITGRVFIGADGLLVMPSQPDGNGVDLVVGSLAVGAPARVALSGLLDRVSLASARRVTEAVSAQVVAEISLNDRRNTEAQLDALLAARPEIVVVTGGTNDGASHSVMQLLEAVGLALYVMEEEQRPEVLYAGNPALVEQVKDLLGRFTVVETAANVRPRLEVEDLHPAQAALAGLYVQDRLRRVAGLEEVHGWCREHLFARPFAFGRVLRFLSQLYQSRHGVLGVALNTTDVTLAAAQGGDLTLASYTDLGVLDLQRWLQAVPVERVLDWLPTDATLADVLDYLHNRALHPESLPLSEDEMLLEQAVGKAVLRVATRRLQARYPYPLAFDPMLVAGDVFRRTAPHHVLQMLLDGVQPTGITTLVMDQYDVSVALGAAAAANPLLTVQVLESNALFSLATVIAPQWSGKRGQPVLRFRVTFEETGSVMRGEVKAGALELIPVPMGQAVKLELQPLRNARLGPGRAGQSARSLRVMGGLFGVVVDARGRPVRLPQDAARRKELLRFWAAQVSD